MTDDALQTRTTKRGTLIVLPAFNESESLPGVIDEIRRHVPDADVLVVDDGSTDDTGDVARGMGVPTISMPFNVGVGGALRAGLLYGRRYGYAAVVQCDADGQHPPESVGLLVRGLDEADLVIGARFAGIGEYEAHGPRHWAMRFLAWTFSRVHNTELTDVTSGFRSFGPRSIEVLSSQLPPEYLGDTVEALVIAKENGLVVRQAPVAMRRRRGGVASHGPLKTTAFLFRAILMLALSLVRLVRRRRPEVAR
jgi:glycosyltransferase involved in cell wall biosynthesis